jgi:RNA polymerase sigma-70 factor (ECF subfamily)
MAGRSRSPAISFPGRVALTRSDDSQLTELQAEVVGLFDQMRGRILRYALSFGLQIPDAEEILQEVFLALYRHLRGGPSRDGLRAWLFRVTHNLALKRRISISRQVGEPMTADGEAESVRIADPHPNPEVQLAFRQRQDRLRFVVNALPETDRECLYLRAEGFRYREIADVLGIALGSVANSLARSLARLSAADERIG